MDDGFTMAELVRAIGRAGHTAPGADQVGYVMLKHLGDGALVALLGLYNRVWEEGRLPRVWKEAVVIPVRKPGKDPTQPSGYRPIALTSNLGKVMERMVCNRLTYVLEKGGGLASYQSGFRKGRNTMDAVVRLENEIRKAQVTKESVVVVFFDIEKAYDMMWREGVLIKLHMLGVGGRVFNWVRDFLSERVIRVRIGAEVSGGYTVSNGTPQGSVISPLLFSVMINDVFSRVGGDVGRALFADDGALWRRGRNLAHVVDKVQGAVDVVVEWAHDWGCRFSVEKTKTVCFTRKRDVGGWKLRMYGKELERVESFKYLGVVFDSKLTWGEHVRRVEGRCRKVINVMRCLSGRDWGASCAALKTVCTAMVRAALDYGCIVYGSAAKSHLRVLDVVYTRALRVCCGAFATTPVAALQVVMGEMPLELRRKQLAVRYWAYLRGHTRSHPTKSVLEECWEYGGGHREHFGSIGNALAREFGVADVRVSATVVWPEVAPWRMVWPEVDWCLLELRRKGEGEDLVRAHSGCMGGVYDGWVQVYTDGSRAESGVTGLGVAVPERGIGISRRTTDGLGVYTVEMVAVLVALGWVEYTQVGRVVVCSDSASVLASIRSFHSSSRQDILFQVIQSVTRIVQRGGQVRFLWVPAHVGVEGNEKADELAKGALVKGKVEMNVRVSRAEVKAMVCGRAMDMWQGRWDREEKGRHCYRVQRSVRARGCRGGGGQRREEIVLVRLRLGHCGLNGTLKVIGKHATGLCEGCDEEESVEHVLLRCGRYEVERRVLRDRWRAMGRGEIRLEGVLGMEDRESVGVLLDYLRATGVYDRI